MWRISHHRDTGRQPGAVRLRFIAIPNGPRSMVIDLNNSAEMGQGSVPP
jgi:hypothetical protein